MAFLDIERIINQDSIGSRFKLVHLAGLRAKELNNPTDETYMSGYKTGQKVTSRALSDIVCGKIAFEEAERRDFRTEEEIAVSLEPEAKAEAEEEK